MTKMWGLGILVAVAGLAGVAIGAANGATADSTYRAVAALTAKQVVKPRPAGDLTKARASLTGTVTVAKHSQIAWNLTFSGTTSKVTSALVQFKNAKGVPTAYSLCFGPCRSGIKPLTFFRSETEAQSFVSQLLAHKVTVLLRTTKNPGGELAGTLKATKVLT